MGAVASFVADVVTAPVQAVVPWVGFGSGSGGGLLGGIGDAIGDVFDAAGDVVEFVTEEVVEPVLQEAVRQVERAVEDPIGTAAMVLSVMYPPAAPFIMPAATALKGGDLEDIALSAGLSYVGSQLATNYAPDVASVLPEGITDATAKQITNVATNALVAGTKAEINGGDFLDAATGALVTGGITAGIGDVVNYAKNEYDSYTPTMTDVPVQDELATPVAEPDAIDTPVVEPEPIDTPVEAPVVEPVEPVDSPVVDPVDPVEAPVSTSLPPVDMPTVSMDKPAEVLPFSTGEDAQNLIADSQVPAPTTEAPEVPVTGGLESVSDVSSSRPLVAEGLGDMVAPISTDIGAISRAEDGTPAPAPRNAADMPSAPTLVAGPDMAAEDPSRLGAAAEKMLTRGVTGALTGAVTGALGNRAVSPTARSAMPRMSPTQLASLRNRPAAMPQQQQQARSPLQQAAPQGFKMPAQKVDIKSLSPVSNISGLMALLNRMKG